MFWVVSSYLVTFFVLIYSQNILENFVKTKLLYLSNFLSNLKLFCYSDFLFSYIYETFFKNLWKQKVLCLSDFCVISSYCVTHVFCSYIFANIYRKIYENKSIMLKWFVL